MRALRFLLLALALGISAPALAQEGTPRGVVSAEELEAATMRQGGMISGRVTLPDQAAANLIQPAGQAWRDFHNRTLTWVGGVAILGMLGVLVVFYLTRGRIRVEGGLSGRTIPRFNLLERANHWMVATSFIILGLTGLNLTFGRFLLLPLVGPETFTAISEAGKIAHNYLSFPFTLGIVLMLLLWVKDNIPNRLDIEWFKQGGGLIGKGHPDSKRFNGGQKMVFWLTILGGGAVAVSGYLLIFPLQGTTVADMQLAHTVHALVGVLMIAAMLAHIYIGSIGMEGAFDAMGSGQVDLNWAKEHHNLWTQEQLAAGRVSGIPGAEAKPAE
ncbi:MAG: formate dehydrogenase subunit gamma [Rhodovarius sp.]|nr:formate dehydrogenase subunit gamma [Rhodovarius sp.]